jgi:hemerythrin-like domain-containing protein
VGASVFDLLVQEHRQILDTLDVLEQCEGAAASEALEHLIELVTMHHAAEEDVLHPLLVQVLGETTTTPFEDEQEHGLVEVLLAETRAHQAGTPAFRGCLTVLRRLIIDHFDREEAEVFSILRERIDEEIASSLRERYVAHEAQLRGSQESVPYGSTGP